ncbi:hypothetical protein [Deinococcus yunweiensis]|uniref:hypothetical protein n=1 Tax=Deinococcus yunweiensis TaxID=367282 RepID=UPI00398F70F2
MTHRDEILRVVRDLVRDRLEPEFCMFEVIERLQWSNSTCTANAVRRVISTRMCGTTHGPSPSPARDLERLGRGRYRLLEVGRQHLRDC